MELLIEKKTDIAWLPPDTEIFIIKSEKLPPIELVTSVCTLCFSGNKLLMIKHDERGWDIPGGHIEPGESLEEALRREVLEEAGATLSECKCFAHFKFQLNGPKPPDFKYPYPAGYIVLYLSKLRSLNEFKGEFETSDRALMTPKEAKKTIWVEGNLKLYEMALAEIGEGIF